MLCLFCSGNWRQESCHNKKGGTTLETEIMIVWSKINLFARLPVLVTVPYIALCTATCRACLMIHARAFTPIHTALQVLYKLTNRADLTASKDECQLPPVSLKFCSGIVTPRTREASTCPLATFQVAALSKALPRRCFSFYLEITRATSNLCVLRGYDSLSAWVAHRRAG